MKKVKFYEIFLQSRLRFGLRQSRNFARRQKGILNLALDTGASATILSARKLTEVGYELDKPEDEIYITTGSGLIFVPKITIEKLSSLGKVKENFTIIAHDLPPTASVDGVLGLDFLRENILTIDFVEGQIELK